MKKGGHKNEAQMENTLADNTYASNSDSKTTGDTNPTANQTESSAQSDAENSTDTEDTVFTLRDIYDNGDRSEDSEASFEDIEKDLSIDLKGEFRGNVFHANAIRINKIH